MLFNQRTNNESYERNCLNEVNSRDQNSKPENSGLQQCQKCVVYIGTADVLKFRIVVPANIIYEAEFFSSNWFDILNKQMQPESVDWIHLAHIRVQWRTIVNTMMNLRALLKPGNLLTTRATVIFSRMAFRHGVNYNFSKILLDTFQKFICNARKH